MVNELEQVRRSLIEAQVTARGLIETTTLRRASLGSVADTLEILDYLCSELARLDEGEKSRSRNASIAVLPKSAIAGIALDLLDAHWDADPKIKAPLFSLFNSLLEVGRRAHGDKGAYAARENAVWLKALDLDITDAELARRVGVNRSSVHRWMKDQRFLDRLNQLTKMIASAEP